MKEDNFEVETISKYDSVSERAIEGSGLMQTRSPYSTAVQVVKPRNLDMVIKRCEMEAAIAGDEFYYAWKQGGEFIEGPTVGAALAIARNFGNCAVDCKIEETQYAYIFHGAFIDLETGFNLVRPFRQNKQSPKNKEGKDIYKGERGVDIIFQIGASKGIRNAVLNGVPKWLVSKVIKKAKENVVKKISEMGVEKARAMIITKANALKIPIERIEASYGLQKGWDIEKLVMLSGSIRSIEEGIESVDALFPIEGGSDQKPIPDSEKKPAPEQPKEIIIEGAGVVDEKTGEIIKEEPAKNPFERGAQGFYLFEVGKIKTKTDYADFEKTYVPEILKNFTGQKLAQVKNALAAKEKEVK